MLTNDIRKLASGQGQYTLMCNERGGVIDDLYAYRLSVDVYFLIINASRIEADVAWLQAQAAKFSGGELNLTDASHHYAAIAVQGPRVKEFINDCIPGASASVLPVSCRDRTEEKPDRAVSILKTTTCSFPAPATPARMVLKSRPGRGHPASLGQDSRRWPPFGIKPCGLGARDTLRTEVCYPLYGHELDEHTTPIEAGVGFFVSLDKGEFNGRSVLAEQKANGVKKKLVAFKMTDKSAPPRPHYPIWANGANVGIVTSGTQSPSLNLGIGMGYVPPEFAKPDTKIEIEIRGKRFAAVVVPKPILQNRQIVIFAAEQAVAY